MSEHAEEHDEWGNVPTWDTEPEVPKLPDPPTVPQLPGPPNAPTPEYVEPIVPGFQPTQVLPTQPQDAIFRDGSDQPISAEEARLAAERSARKEARLQALSTPAAPVVVPAATPAQQPVKLNTDKFFGSLGLFLLRLVVAGILGIRGVYWLADLNQATLKLAGTIIPIQWHGLAVLIAAIGSLLIALGLIVGLLTRVAGAALAVLTGAALALVWWGPFAIFTPQTWPGFYGELELLLAAVGLLLLLLGGGGWSLDRSFRSRRAKNKLAREVAA